MMNSETILILYSLTYSTYTVKQLNVTAKEQTNSSNIKKMMSCDNLEQV